MNMNSCLFYDSIIDTNRAYVSTKHHLLQLNIVFPEQTAGYGLIFRAFVTCNFQQCVDWAGILMITMTISFVNTGFIYRQENAVMNIRLWHLFNQYFTICVFLITVHVHYTHSISLSTYWGLVKWGIPKSPKVSIPSHGLIINDLDHWGDTPILRHSHTHIQNIFNICDVYIIYIHYIYTLYHSSHSLYTQPLSATWHKNHVGKRLDDPRRRPPSTCSCSSRRRWARPPEAGPCQSRLAWYFQRCSKALLVGDYSHLILFHMVLTIKYIMI